MRHLIDIMDLSIEELDEMIGVAKDIIADPEKYAHKCAGKKLPCMSWAETSWASLRRRAHPQRKVRAWQTPSAL